MRNLKQSMTAECNTSPATYTSTSTTCKCLLLLFGFADFESLDAATCPILEIIHMCVRAVTSFVRPQAPPQECRSQR